MRPAWLQGKPQLNPPGGCTCSRSLSWLLRQRVRAAVEPPRSSPTCSGEQPHCCNYSNFMVCPAVFKTLLQSLGQSILFCKFQYSWKFLEKSSPAMCLLAQNSLFCCSIPGKCDVQSHDPSYCHSADCFVWFITMAEIRLPYIACMIKYLLHDFICHV